MWLVTRNAQDLGANAHPPEAAQAPLWGLGRVVPLEYPHMWGGLIDLPPRQDMEVRHDAEALATEILQAGREDQVALRQGKRFAARFVRVPRGRAEPVDRIWRHDATYLITGGLGMLGLRVAQWLVRQHGVRHLVLTGRSGARGAAQDAVTELQTQGAHVHVMQADITVETDVQRVMEAIQNQLPPLKGVIHCAGILDDGVFGQMQWPKFTRVTAPKIKGG